jgi:colanic acid biosynthesis glycosyl transferase WcaI
MYLLALVYELATEMLSGRVVLSSKICPMVWFVQGPLVRSYGRDLEEFYVKILIYSLNFSPELTGIGKYSGEMVDWLASHGHEVRVVTAPPYYPAWKVSAGFSSRRYSSEKNGLVTVFRCPLWVPSKPSGLKRLLHLAFFALSSFPVLMRLVTWRANVVWVVAPAFFCVPGALLCGRLSGAKTWVHVQDFEVDAAFDLGLLKGNALKRIALGLESWLLRRFDRFSTISGRMLSLATAKRIDVTKAVIFPNWVDLSAITPSNNLPAEGGYRSELAIPSGAIVALYSGNMGAKQGLDILAEAATRLSRRSDIYFVFCGNGAGRRGLEDVAAGVINVRFLDLQPLERLGELLSMADIHLLPQRADAADLVMPSKLTGMLASGKPVVATAHQNTELAMVVHGCGLVVPPESVSEFVGAIETLASDAELRRRLGSAGRCYAENNLDQEAVLKNFESQLGYLIAN